MSSVDAGPRASTPGKPTHPLPPLLRKRAVVFFDARGNGHLLNHTVFVDGRSECGYGHHYALGSNLSQWTPTGVAVPCAFAWVNGTVATPFRRERPELLLDRASGSLRPLVLFGGVMMYEQAVTDESFTLAVPVL